MDSLWDAAAARRMVERYEQQGVGADLALRVYSSRLLGGDPRLVLHGGGNTSVKTEARDITGENVEVLCVKGSGWDMADIEPPGLPAVRLAPLRALRGLAALTDADMVNVQRRNLLDSKAPNPSVETLLHAFLAHKFIDHTHANAVLALTDQPDGEAICREVYGDRAALVPYVMPGFALAKLAAEVFEANPESEGLVLLKHGIFSYADTAEEAYARMVALVSLAETRLARGKTAPVPGASLPPRLAAPGEVAPILRGLLAIEAAAGDGAPRRFILTHRGGAAVRAYVAGAERARSANQGPVTPDHAIRTKPRPLLLPAPEAGDLAGFAAAAAEALAAYERDYHAYFTRHDGRPGGPRTELDPKPRVLLVPGLGLFAAGDSAKAAAVAADLAETTVEVVAAAESLGRYESIPEADQFDIEYWSLEQAKLGKAAEKPLARQVAVITGGAGAIGAATAAAFRAEGAEVALIDRDAAALAAVAGRLGGLALAADVTDREALAAAFGRLAEAFGGLDILVSNAGAAWQGRIGEVQDRVLRDSFELNFFAHQTAARAAVAVMEAQGTGGCLLFNASKQALNPGPGFGPYGLPKAATLALMRQYAVDYGRSGIRANAVNADRIRSGLLTDEMVASRAEARGVSEETYMRGNLLGREVRAEDVAQAFVALAKARKTTAAILTVDGGNLAAALR